jgi:hypothetical protein
MSIGERFRLEGRERQVKPVRLPGQFTGNGYDAVMNNLDKIDQLGSIHGSADQAQTGGE